MTKSPPLEFASETDPSPCRAPLRPAPGSRPAAGRVRISSFDRGLRASFVASFFPREESSGPINGSRIRCARAVRGRHGRTSRPGGRSPLFPSHRVQVLPSSRSEGASAGRETIRPRAMPGAASNPPGILRHRSRDPVRNGVPCRPLGRVRGRICSTRRRSRSDRPILTGGTGAGIDVFGECSNSAKPRSGPRHLPDVHAPTCRSSMAKGRSRSGRVFEGRASKHIYRRLDSSKGTDPRSGSGSDDRSVSFRPSRRRAPVARWTGSLESATEAPAEAGRQSFRTLEAHYRRNACRVAIRSADRTHVPVARDQPTPPVATRPRGPIRVGSEDRPLRIRRCDHRPLGRRGRSPGGLVPPTGAPFRTSSCRPAQLADCSTPDRSGNSELHS